MAWTDDCRAATRRACWLVLSTAVAGCLDVRWQGAGEPCVSDRDCFERCVEVDGRGICHGVEPLRCDEDPPDDAPCLRALSEGETGCDDRVRIGSWRCVDGNTTCRVKGYDFREQQGNACDDDSDGKIDETPGMCPGGFVRGQFEGFEGLTGAHYGASGRAAYGFGTDPGHVQPGQCLDDPRPGEWVTVHGERGPMGGVLTDACHPPPTSPDEFAHYEGPWIRMPLSTLNHADAFGLTLHLIARPLGSTCTTGVRGPLDELHVWLVDPSGAPRRIPVDLEDGHYSHPSAVAPCVPFSPGLTTLYLLAHALGGCPCDDSDCDDAPFLALDSVQLDP